jgi:hypothetical protein
MGIFTRLKTGVVLTKDSLLVIRHNPKLALFPVVSGVAGIAFLAVFLGVTFGFASLDMGAGVLGGLFLTYLVLTFVSSFFTAGLVHQTRSVLSGAEPSLGDGIAAAWERKTPILVWSLISATVGIIINAVESSDSRVARIFGAVFGLAWTLMTFFVIPVVVFERTSTTGMFKRSAGLFRDTYGETPISLLGIQLVSALVALPFVAPGFYLYSSGVASVGIGLLLVGVLLSYLLTQTLQGVVKTTLYLYAQEGEKPSEFDNLEFDDLNAGGRRGRNSTVGARTGGFQ